jgi:hypothetical protein
MAMVYYERVVLKSFMRDFISMDTTDSTGVFLRISKFLNVPYGNSIASSSYLTASTSFTLGTVF